MCIRGITYTQRLFTLVGCNGRRRRWNGVFQCWLMVLYERSNYIGDSNTRMTYAHRLFTLVGCNGRRKRRNGVFQCWLVVLYKKINNSIT